MSFCKLKNYERKIGILGKRNRYIIGERDLKKEQMLYMIVI